MGDTVNLGYPAAPTIPFEAMEEEMTLPTDVHLRGEHEFRVGDVVRRIMTTQRRVKGGGWAIGDHGTVDRLEAAARSGSLGVYLVEDPQTWHNPAYLELIHDANGWHPWKGGDNPAGEARVEYILRSYGAHCLGHPASELRWSAAGGGADIVAWRYADRAEEAYRGAQVASVWIDEAQAVEAAMKSVDISRIREGDEVLVSGTVFAAGDRVGTHVITFGAGTPRAYNVHVPTETIVSHTPKAIQAGDAVVYAGCHGVVRAIDKAQAWIAWNSFDPPTPPNVMPLSQLERA